MGAQMEESFYSLFPLISITFAVPMPRIKMINNPRGFFVFLDFGAFYPYILCRMQYVEFRHCPAVGSGAVETDVVREGSMWI